MTTQPETKEPIQERPRSDGQGIGEIKEMEDTKVLRYRVNISRGMKGQFSFEATVDAEGYEMPGVLALSDLLVRELEKRYPPQIGEK